MSIGNDAVHTTMVHVQGLQGRGAEAVEENLTFQHLSRSRLGAEFSCFF